MMNKFRGPQDGSFRLISSCVKELFNHARIIEFRTAEERECLQMLASDYREYKDRNAMRVPGTCEWFLGHGKFLSWRKENTASLLWVSADPGCGKSVLSKALVDERLLSADSAMPSICYFFFKDDSDDLQSSSDALCALLHQLFIQKPALLKHVMPDFGNYGLRLRAEFGALWDILKKAAADPEAGEIVCVLDALDECKELEKGRLIERLCGFYSTQIKTNTRLKFLITSRPYFDIETAFGEKIEDLTSIRLEGERESKKISEEIDLVIDNVIPRISRARKYPLKLEVQNALVEHLKSIPHRTYLWLHLILDVVRRTPDSTKARLERLVNKIPDSVDKAYEGILKRIDDSEQARRLLHIIVAAERPLTLREMNLALAIDEKLGSRDVCRSYNDLDLEPEEPFETKVRDLCGLFVSVIDSKIYLIHQTAKEFLIYKGIVKVPNSADNRPIIWKHSLEPVESNLVLTSICISYLLFTEFESDPLVIDDRAEYGKVSKIVDRYTNKHGFLDYSATYWANHFREAKVKEMAILESALKVCNTRSKRFLTWFQVYWITIEYYRCPQNFASLMVASYFGQEAVVQQLLEKWADLDVNCKDEDSRTALSWAARNGHETVVQQLLEKRADLDVNYKDEHSRTALSWAAENGHEAVVRQLLEKRADLDVNYKDEYGRTALSLAAENGHEAVVRQLLEKRADLDVNYKDEYGRTALSRAAENGHGAIVKLLTSTSHS
jgi:hypothetical protein